MKVTPRFGASVRLLLSAAATVGLVGSALAQPPGPPGEQFKVVTFVEGLKNPWSMAWLPNGDMLVTERGGTLRLVKGGKLLPDPIAGTPKVRAQGQGGTIKSNFLITLNLIGKMHFDFRLADRRSQQDAPACRGSREFGNCNVRRARK